ncbi:hypothetical protein [Streptomyces pseudogriseolus]|uniref:hypothetical protein n=1 Tax=Streptomyces pseudogriseolus TaxID=36817 RepID=UPI001CE36097|nr:hypothetical protein [Streptomyces pseudogriseolus]
MPPAQGEDGARSGGHGRAEDVFTESLLTRVYDQPVEVLPHPRGGTLLVLPVRQR